MLSNTVIESLGSRIVSAARMAVEMHLAMDQKSSQIGGADRCVTDDGKEEDER